MESDDFGGWLAVERQVVPLVQLDMDVTATACFPAGSWCERKNIRGKVV